MELLIAVGLLAIGFVFLIKGADFFVDGASSVAHKLRVPSLIIGMTIVAMGTSLPELSVSVAASAAGSNTLAVSNVVGSNIFNLMVVLGASALLSTMYVSDETLKKDYPFSVGCAVLLLVLGAIGMSLGRIDGIILLIIFIIFLVVQVRGALKARRASLEAEKDSEGAQSKEIKDMPVWRSILYIVGGAVAVKFGGDWVVNGAVTVARTFLCRS